MEFGITYVPFCTALDYAFKDLIPSSINFSLVDFPSSHFGLGPIDSEVQNVNPLS